jgi:hypothetical protein
LPANASNKWTPSEDERLQDLVVANASAHLIAAKLKRSVPAIKGRAHILGLSLKRVERSAFRSPPPKT